MKIGDLVRYRKCGTHGVVIRVREIPTHARFITTEYSNELMLEVLWSDGKVSDTLSRRVTAVCK